MTAREGWRLQAIGVRIWGKGVRILDYNMWGRTLSLAHVHPQSTGLLTPGFTPHEADQCHMPHDQGSNQQILTHCPEFPTLRWRPCWQNLSTGVGGYLWGRWDTRDLLMLKIHQRHIKFLLQVLWRRCHNHLGDGKVTEIPLACLEPLVRSFIRQTFIWHLIWCQALF